MATNPEVQAKLREEIDNFYNVNNLKAPMSYLDTQKLPYLQAVIKEAIRLLPSIVFQLPRHTPPDFEVRGIKIPANTTIGISPIAQNRDQEIWGPDANEFRPSRWLENEDKTRYFDRSTMTFGGSGPRVCIGRNIALVSRTGLCALGRGKTDQLRFSTGRAAQVRGPVRAQLRL